LSIFDALFPIRSIVGNSRTASGISDAGLAWIQIVESTKLDPNNRPIAKSQETFLDNKTRTDGKPYYTAGGFLRTSSSTWLFEDAPQVGNIYDSFRWTGQLFLAQVIEPPPLPPEITAKTVIKIYDGVQWGWESIFRPENQNRISSLLPSPLPGASLPSYCSELIYDGNGYYCSANALEPSVNSDFTAAPSQQIELVSNSDAKEIPTPAILPSLVATGIYHGRKWRKRKQQNQNCDTTAA
jgi:hypothetical protein